MKIGFPAIAAVFFACSLVSAAEQECMYCHDEMIDRPVKHAAAVQGCTGCHAPHGEQTDERLRLRKPLNELCFDCHSPQKLNIAQGHIIDNHPTYLKRDPMNPDKEFTCVTCHNPHGSEMPTLFRKNYTKPPYKGNLCLTCHPFY